MAYPVLAHWPVRVKDEVPLSGPQPLQSSLPTILCSVLLSSFVAAAPAFKR